MRSLIILVLSCSACSFDVDVGALAAPNDAQAPVSDGSGPIDILFVVDNSGSMADKQVELARTIYKAECPISDLTQVPESLRDPPPEVAADLAQVCGFSQMLAAFGRDFHIGVITTDVDACDNALPDQEGGGAWGFHPQRGCLQPVPGTDQKVITKNDVDVSGKFLAVVAGVGTFGSPFERGLDAAEAFLTHDTWVADGCDGDRDAFLRPDAELSIIFVSDEDDCSHEDASGTFPDETQTTCGENISLVTNFQPPDCYARAAELVPPAHYVDLFRSVKSDPSLVSVGVIAGAVDAGGQIVASGCISDSGGVPISSCFESEGSENFTAPGEPCDPDTNGGNVCCNADAAPRYLSLQNDIAVTAGSICRESFVDTLITAVTSP